MIDLYNIPNDDDKNYRMDKFVEYQHKVPAIHPITLMKYIKDKELSKNDLIRLAYIQSITYCEITTILVFEDLNEHFYDKDYIQKYWEANKDKLIFNSARKWVRRKDMFCRLINDFNSIFGVNPYEKLITMCKYGEEKNYKIIKIFLSQIKDCGRFAQDLFLEMMLMYYKHGLIEIRLKEPFVLDWKKDANMTSGLLNIIYEDEKANEFDKNGTIDKQTQKQLYCALIKIQNKIKEKYPKQDNSLQSFMTKICSFRNLFKATRYGGYHHDRQLENIIKYKQTYPEKEPILNKLLNDRLLLFDHKLLGELNGWNGVRKDMKKLWLKTGKTGVEEIDE